MEASTFAAARVVPRVVAGVESESQVEHRDAGGVTVVAADERACSKELQAFDVTGTKLARIMMNASNSVGALAAELGR